MTQTVNSFIKCEFEDVTLSGKIINVTDDHIVIIDKDGHEYGLSHDDNITEINQPKSWKENTYIAITPDNDSKEEVKKPRKKREGITKVDLVMNLLNEEPELINNRKEAIKRIVEVIGMTEAGASTYYSNAKKKL